MDIIGTMSALETFIQGMPSNVYSTPSGNPLPVYKFRAPDPYPATADSPFLIIVPRRIMDRPISGGGAPGQGMQAQGPYRLWFFERVSGDVTGAGIILEHVSTFATAFTQYLGLNPDNRQLHGRVAYAGWGQGTSFGGDQIAQLFDVEQESMLGVPIDVEIQELAQF